MIDLFDKCILASYDYCAFSSKNDDYKYVFEIIISETNYLHHQAIFACKNGYRTKNNLRRIFRCGLQ
jgi:hypothetical protein